MIRRLLPVLILALGVGGFVAMKATRPTAPPVTPRERIWHVETLAVTPAVHRPLLSLFGRVEAPDRIHAAMPVAGRIQDVLVRDGEDVADDALLARLDPSDLEPRLAQARAEVAKEALRFRHDQEALVQEQALLTLAETAVERLETVQSQRLGTEADVDQAREELARARLAVTLREQSIAEHPARLAALEAKLDEAERDAARGEIRAPFAARIGVVEAAPGDQVQPNQTILTLYPLDGLYVRAKIPGAHGATLREALIEGETLHARVNDGNESLEATLERLAGEADARGVDALLKLDAGARVPLGAFVDVQLDLPAEPDTIAVPFSTLFGGDRIFTVTEGRLRGLPVQRVGEVALGAAHGLLLRAPGLAPGTQVMVTHLPNAVDGLKVETVTERLPTAAESDAVVAPVGPSR
jgi:multidrug efflux pump subunit AcrA (membrane-fusion protein)